jgi:hypothetical protein
MQPIQQAVECMTQVLELIVRTRQRQARRRVSRVRVSRRRRHLRQRRQCPPAETAADDRSEQPKGR